MSVDMAPKHQPHRPRADRAPYAMAASEQSSGSSNSSKSPRLLSRRHIRFGLAGQVAEFSSRLEVTSEVLLSRTRSCRGVAARGT